MGKLKLDISMSLDGFVAGPNITLENPLGDGGEAPSTSGSSASRRGGRCPRPVRR